MYAELERLCYDVERVLLDDSVPSPISLEARQRPMELSDDLWCRISDGTFQTAFRYDDVEQVRNAFHGWMLCAMLETAKLRLLLTHAVPSAECKLEKRARIGRLFALAGFFCQSVWYLSSLESIAYSKVIIVALSMARTIFQQGGTAKRREFEWVQSCLLCTTTRVERLRQLGRTTMCCFDDLAVGYADNCRWMPQLACLLGR